jgi:hypothetical protein
VIPVEVFGTNEDEMALGHILAKPTYLDRFTLSKADVPGQVIWKMPVSPRACVKEISARPPPQRDNVVNLNTNLSYMAELFRNWRGTIRYHFKIVKTPYHSARIRVLFVPGVFEDTPSAGIDIDKVYSQVIDIREMSSFDFEVPFVFNQPWMSLRAIDLGLVSVSIPTGMVYVEVLNALRNPAAATDHIEILVETSAGPDFQFAYPNADPDTQLYPRLTPSTFRTGTAHQRSPQVRKLGEVQPLEYRAPTVSKEPGLFETFALKNILAKKQPKSRPAQVAPSEPIGVLRQLAQDVVGVDIVRPRPRTEDRTVTDADWIASLPPIDYTQTRPAPRPDIKPAQKVKMTLDQASRLPIGTADEIPVVVPGKEPTHSYTAHDQSRLWRKFLRDNPNEDPDKIWPEFSYQYPQNRVKREVGTPQSNSQLVKSEVDTSPEVNAFGMGEIVTSLRQLMKRYAYIGEAKPVIGNASLIYPGVGAGWAASRPLFNAATFSTVWDRIDAIYRWRSGAIRVALQPSIGDIETDAPVLVSSQPGFLASAIPPGTTRIITVLGANPASGEAFAPIFPRVEKFMELELPMYQRVPAIPTSLGAPPPQDLDRGGIGTDTVPANHGTALRINGPASLGVWRAIGEDFAYGYHVGPPLTGSN